ncbi:hypothetical protein BDZ89DRAFT_1074793 [Hymenopellis radicata]|nr:hypothetical protein BDZ89DRAFT_1074793 [Hymenopellis radicata]
MGSMNGALTSALSAYEVHSPVSPSHPAPPPEPLSPLPPTAPSSSACTDSMHAPMHDVSNVRPALPPELSPSTPHLSRCPAAQQDRLGRALPGLKGLFKS